MNGISVHAAQRDVVSVTGPEGVAYVHGQVSQDVEDMAVGESRLSFLLQPQGKVDALLRITRTGEDSLVLDTEAGHGEPMLASLSRFRLRTKVEFTELDWSMLAVFGAGVEDIPTSDELPGVEVIVEGLFGSGDGSVDLLGPDPRFDCNEVLDATQYDRARIAASFPMMGKDIDTSTIPNETGLVDRSVSFTKGCYRGQELVERIHSRGGNRRMLRRLELTGQTPIADTQVYVGDGLVGQVTSVAGGDPALALAYIKGGTEETDELRLDWVDSSGRAQTTSARLTAVDVTSA